MATVGKGLPINRLPINWPRADFIILKPYGDRLIGLPLLLMDMRRGIPQNKRGVRCSNCGPTLGTSANIGQGGLRCQSCGQFAEPCPTYCAKHETYWGGLSGYDHCPMCREEQRIEDERQHMMTRDTRVEPW